jgi:hypothetical protein
MYPPIKSAEVLAGDYCVAHRYPPDRQLPIT